MQPFNSFFFKRLRTPAWTRAIATVVRRHRTSGAFLLFLTFILICSFQNSTKYRPSQRLEPDVVSNNTLNITPETTKTTRTARFAKVAVASGFEDIMYEKALHTHLQHAKKHGYPMYVARENAAEGMFNKIAYVMNVLLKELFKPAEDRVEWIFYSDADSIIMNQEVPLEIFEPPLDFSHINWMAGKDHNGLNAGVFILRVSQWSLNLLSRVMTYKHYHPTERYTFEEQTILARLTEGDEEFVKESIYVPRVWLNAYFYSLQEVRPGLLLSHFPHPDYKWHIYEWLHVLESDEDENFEPVYNVPLSQTVYPREIDDFWNAKRRADAALTRFEKNVQRGADPIRFGMQHEETKALAQRFRDKLIELKKAAAREMDEFGKLEQLTDESEDLNAQLIRNLTTYFETHDKPPLVSAFLSTRSA